MNLYDAQKIVADALTKTLMAHPFVTDISHVFSGGIWWYSVWHEHDVAPVGAEKDFRNLFGLKVDQFSFKYEINYIPNATREKPSLTVEEIDVALMTLGEEDVSNDFDTPEFSDEEETRTIHRPVRDNKGELVYDENGEVAVEVAEQVIKGGQIIKSTLVGAQAKPIPRASSMSSQNSGNPSSDTITVAINHWLPAQEIYLKHCIGEAMKRFARQFGDDMESRWHTFIDEGPQRLQLFDDPKKRNMFRWIIPAYEPMFMTSKYFHNNIQAMEHFCQMLNYDLTEGEFFAPIFFLRPGKHDFRIFFQPGSQSGLMDAIDTYSKVLCHMNS